MPPIPRNTPAFQVEMRVGENRSSAHEGIWPLRCLSNVNRRQGKILHPLGAAGDDHRVLEEAQK